MTNISLADKHLQSTNLCLPLSCIWGLYLSLNLCVEMCLISLSGLPKWRKGRLWSHSCLHDPISRRLDRLDDLLSRSGRRELFLKRRDGRACYWDLTNPRRAVLPPQIGITWFILWLGTPNESHLRKEMTSRGSWGRMGMEKILVKRVRGKNNIIVSMAKDYHEVIHSPDSNIARKPWNVIF